MAEANNSNPSDKFSLQATAHERSQVNQVGQINATTVIFGNAQRNGKPFQVPPLPSYYVDRPEHSQELKKRLLTAWSLQSEYHRAEALSRLADKLPELLPQALAAARSLQDERARVKALSHLADKLPPEWEIVLTNCASSQSSSALLNPSMRGSVRNPAKS